MNEIAKSNVIYEKRALKSGFKNFYSFLGFFFCVFTEEIAFKHFLFTILHSPGSFYFNLMYQT